MDYTIKIYEFANIPIHRLIEDTKNNKLANYYSTNFQSRFGTVVDPIQINDQIDMNDFKNILEKNNIRSYINKYNIPKENKIIKFEELYNNRIEIYEYTIKRYIDKEISAISLSHYLLSLSLLILYSNPMKKDIRILCNSINQYANEICRNTQAIKYADNRQSDKYQSFEYLTELRDELKDHVRGNHLIHMKYIKLCMNTYIPPLRLELQDMQYKQSDEEPINDPETKTNYLIRFDDIYYIVINHDKVISKFKQQIFKLDQTNQYMNCVALTECLNRSFNILPRKYVICPRGKPDEPMNNTSFNDLLKCSQNILRQAYHTYYEKIYHPSLTNNELNDIALRMRHSLNTARAIYIKVAPINPPNNQLIEQEKKDNRTAYQKQYNKKYFNKDSYGYKRASDNKYLSYLKSGKIKKPSAKMLNKHGIYKVDDTYEFTIDKLNERLI